jgi:hypothetical protein
MSAPAMALKGKPFPGEAPAWLVQEGGHSAETNE